MSPAGELNRRRLLLGAAAGAAATVGAVAAAAASGETGGVSTQGEATVSHDGRLGHGSDGHELEARDRRRRGRGSLSDIEHVVILMQENRSFDHYYGTLRGVRGFADTAALPGVFEQPDTTNLTGGTLLPYHLDTFTVDAQQLDTLDHGWPTQHAGWNNGRNNNWVAAQNAVNKPGAHAMAFFERRDIPFHYALADAFTICDNYHCSMMGPTTPNRVYLFSGKVDVTAYYATSNPPTTHRRMTGRPTLSGSRKRGCPGRCMPTTRSATETMGTSATTATTRFGCSTNTTTL